MKYRSVLQRISPSFFPACNIAILWSIGLACGRICGQKILLMHSYHITVSALNIGTLFYLVLWQILPVAVIWFVTSRAARGVLPLIVLLRSCCTGVSATVITKLYSSAGWLVYRILFFSDVLVSLLLLWLIFKLSLSRRTPANSLFYGISVAVVFICVLDFALISKFCILL